MDRPSIVIRILNGSAVTQTMLSRFTIKSLCSKFHVMCVRQKVWKSVWA